MSKLGRHSGSSSRDRIHCWPGPLQHRRQRLGIRRDPCGSFDSRRADRHQSRGRRDHAPLRGYRRRPHRLHGAQSGLSDRCAQRGAGRNAAQALSLARTGRLCRAGGSPRSGANTSTGVWQSWARSAIVAPRPVPAKVCSAVRLPVRRVRRTVTARTAHDGEAGR